MNRIIIIFISVFLMSYSHAQVKIYINAGINSSVGVLQNNGGVRESNDLIINNGFDKNNCTVIITQPLSSGSSTFNFNFGKNGMAGLMKGENKFIFNSSGTIVSYPDKKQHLNSPCRIQVLDENSKILSDTTIDYKKNENSKDVITSRVV
jgi:hypothetical protein